jgi:hypothetical protein
MPAVCVVVVVVRTRHACKGPEGPAVTNLVRDHRRGGDQRGGGHDCFRVVDQGSHQERDISDETDENKKLETNKGKQQGRNMYLAVAMLRIPSGSMFSFSSGFS